MILVRQEKIAILVLVIVLVVVLVSAGILELTGKGFFSNPYGPDSIDGELVYHEGIVEESSATATGGHRILVVSGVRVFVPSSCIGEDFPNKGQNITLYGVVQTYRGEREILIRAPADIRPVDPPA